MSKQYKSPVERADEAIAALSGEGQDDPKEVKAAEPEVEQTTQEDEPEAAEPEKAQAEDENSPTYKQRWEALQGMFNGERRKVERLQHELSSLKEQMERSPQGRQADSQLRADATQGEIAEHLSSLATEFGDDFTTALQSVVRGEISTMLEQRMRPVEERVTQVAQTSEEAQRDVFNRTLEGMSPGWRSVYNDPGFQQWLDTTVDDFAGRPFRDLFDDANNAWDAPRIARFFNKYQEATGKTTPKKDARATHDDPRQKLVSPGKSNAGTPEPAERQAKIWTIGEVNKFFTDFRQGKYRGREDEAAKIEAEIDRANIEGRIQ